MTEQQPDRPADVFDVDEATAAAIDGGAVFQVIRAEYRPDGVRVIREVCLHGVSLP